MPEILEVLGSSAEKQQIYRRIAQLHIACINQGFLPTLGPRFLALMYQAIDEGSDSVLLVRRDGDQIIGFVAGANGMSPIYRRMMRHGVRLILALLPSALSVTRLKRMVEILRYSTGSGSSFEGPRAELLSFGIDPHFRRQGHAEALFHELCGAFGKRAIPAFKIVAGESLAPAHRFYRKMGAIAIGTLSVHPGESSTVYRVSLGN